MRAHLYPIGVGILGVMLLAADGAAVELPAGFEDTVVVSGFAGPTSMAWGPAGEVWVAGKLGQLWVVKPGAGPSLVATLPVSSEGERGIGALAADPDFATNGVLWTYYTAATSPPRNRLSRLTVQADQLTQEVIVLDGPPLLNTFHNGGCLRFAADGSLFLGMGDDEQGAATAQQMSDPRGKILRLAPSGAAAAGNPFRAPGADPRVWAYGFRNPFRCSIQPGTGALFVGDVGGSAWEEVNIGVAGGNFGWPTVEGGEPAGRPSVEYPRFTYAHEGGVASAVTGGDHARAGDLKPGYAGQYFFGDSAGGRLYRMVLDAANRPIWTEVWATGVPQPVDIQFGPGGSLYYLAFGPGELHKVSYVGTSPPRVPRGPVP